MDYAQIITQFYQTGIPEFKELALDYIWFDAVARIGSGLLCLALFPAFTFGVQRFYKHLDRAEIDTWQELWIILFISCGVGAFVSVGMAVFHLYDRWVWIALFRPDLALLAKLVEAVS